MAGLQQIIDKLIALDEDSVVKVITAVLAARPELAPPVVTFAVPDLTYPPAKCLSERRSSGVIKSFNDEKGYGFVACQDLHDVFGADVFLHSKQNPGFQRGANVSFAVAFNKDNKPQAFDLQAAGGKGGGKMGGGMGVIMPMGGMMAAMAGFNGKGAGKRPMTKGPDEAEVLGNFQGSIKSFNKATGYGFIECPDVKMYYGKDIFLHHQQLSGFDIGDTVMFTCYLNSQGQPQGKDLKGPGGGPSKKQGADAAAAKSKGPDEAEVLGDFLGNIKSFNVATGYGFIECPDIKMHYGKDIFLHHQQQSGFDIGDMVMFTCYLNSKGQPQAKDLKGPDGGPSKKQRRA